MRPLLCRVVLASCLGSLASGGDVATMRQVGAARGRYLFIPKLDGLEIRNCPIRLDKPPAAGYKVVDIWRPLR